MANLKEVLGNKKKPLAALVLVVLLGAGGYCYYQSENQAAWQQEHQLSLSGNVDVREVALSFRGSDRIKEILVEEGDTVKSGQVLARLDSQELTLQIAALKSQIRAQESAVQRLENGTRAEELAQSAAKAEAAQAEAQVAQQDLDKKQQAYESSQGRTVSRQALDDAIGRARVASANAEEARQAYLMAQAGPRIEDIEEARAQLQAMRDDLATQEYLLSQMELTAPSDGLVRSRLLEPGDMASPQQPVFKISLNDKKWVRAYVNETALGRIHEGMAAQVYTDTYPDQPISGQIGYISGTAEFTPKTVQTDELRTSLLYEVRVYVDDPENVLRMGMPATVKIDM